MLYGAALHAEGDEEGGGVSKQYILGVLLVSRSPQI